MNDARVRDVTAPQGPDRERPVPVYMLPHIWCGTFFFGPLCGAWLVSRNFRAYGDEGSAFRAVISGIFAVVGVSYALAYTTRIEEVFVLSLVVASAATLLSHLTQRRQIEACRALGFPEARGERVMATGIPCLLASAALCLFIWFATEAAFPDSIPALLKLLD